MNAQVKAILRRSVLESPGQATKAWSVLINEALRLIRTHGHADRAKLLDALNSADVGVRASRSYREDIRRLRDHTGRVASLLADHSFIRLGKHPRADPAPLCPTAPGGRRDRAGTCCRRTWRRQVRCAAFASSRLSLTRGGKQSCSRPSNLLSRVRGVMREELRLEHDVVDVLANWPGARPGLLLIDALDAARTEPSAAALRSLIREVGERADQWNVVASIREYDARYTRDLAGVFEGAPPEAPTPPLAGESFARMRPYRRWAADG